MNNKVVIVIIAICVVLSGCHRAPDQPLLMEAEMSPAVSLPTDEESAPDLPEPSTPTSAQGAADETNKPTEPVEPTSEPETLEPVETTPAPEPERPVLPDGFSYISDINPNILVDLRYAGTNNFTGSIVDGYNSSEAAILTTTAATALSKAQEYLEEESLGMLIYDAYRPAKASRYFVEWSKNDDVSTKADYYPMLKKSDLHAFGYIAENSGHSRGSTVDLTLVDITTGNPLDMGGTYDLLDELSWHSNSIITLEQKENRKRLKNVMSKFGFSSYSKEWWHYIYRDEPFPNTYFDFDVG